ncbi:ABC transporter permease [bacterium]|nr:MAG: ABC transporter permease [bacterium]
MSIGYFVKEGVSGFKRAHLATITSITALAIAVLLVGMMVRMGYNAYYLAQKMREMIIVEAFLNDINNEQIQSVQQAIQRKKEVAKMEFVSKDDARKLFLSSFGDEGSGLADLDFLPASIRITFKEGVQTPQIKHLIADISKWKEIDEVRFDENLLNILESRIRTVGLIGAGISFLIMLMALLLVYNTIRLTIFSKQTIIRAMKLVGATKGFIRRPFLIEGMLQGVIGGSLSSLGIIGIFQYVLPKYIEQLGVLSWPFGRWYYLIGGMISFGTLLGLIGSHRATKKFINAVRLSN